MPQWLLASALILPQSILLGMTFPLMSSSVLRLGSAAGGRVFAVLYFSNSAGAVIGVLLAGFWLIEDYGLRAAMMSAGVGNLVVAAVAMLRARRGRAGCGAPDARRKPRARVARLCVPDGRGVVRLRNRVAANAGARPGLVDPDASCRRIIGLLDQVQRGSPVIDVLRAHQAALSVAHP